MSNLLASAAGKEARRPPPVTAGGFIIPGEYRTDAPDRQSPASDGVKQESPPESPASEGVNLSSQPNSPASSDVKLYSQSEDSLPSYVPCYDNDGYSSPATYVRGDFYHLSPPASPTRLDRNTNTERPRVQFSIESLLGPRTDTEDGEGPAVVYSSLTAQRTYCTSGQYRFSMTDWEGLRSFARAKVSDSASPHAVLFWCHACERFCESEEDARIHQTRHSSMKHPCRLQKRLFTEHGFVTAHEETSYFNKMQCSLCDKVVTKFFFSKHMQTHDGHVCYMCGYETSSKTSLTDHHNVHLGLTPYHCRSCDRKFAEKSKLSAHERSHKRTPYSCRFCGQTLSSKHARTVHERIHTGISPFVCGHDGCNKSFPQKTQLKLHEKSHL